MRSQVDLADLRGPFLYSSYVPATLLVAYPSGFIVLPYVCSSWFLVSFLPSSSSCPCNQEFCIISFVVPEVDDRGSSENPKVLLESPLEYSRKFSLALSYSPSFIHAREDLAVLTSSALGRTI